jgi:hypothetical protein
MTAPGNLLAGGRDLRIGFGAALAWGNPAPSGPPNQAQSEQKQSKATKKKSSFVCFVAFCSKNPRHPW